MIRFFKSPQPVALMVVALIVFFLWAQAFFFHPFVIIETGAPLYVLFVRFLVVIPSFFQVLLAMAFISFEAIYFNNLLNRHGVLYKNSYLPALMYALLMSLALPFLQFHPMIVVNLLLLRAIDKTFLLFKNDAPISPLFDSCFLFSIASLFYFPAAAFFLLFAVSLAVLRPVNFREWMISLIGLILPYFFLSVYYFWTDQLAYAWKMILANFTIVPFRIDFKPDQPMLFLIVLIGLLFVLSFRSLMRKFYKNTVRTRSFQQIMMLFMMIAALSCIVLKITQLYHFTLLAIPLSVFFAYYFMITKKRPWVSEMLLWLMFALVVWNHV